MPTGGSVALLLGPVPLKQPILTNLDALYAAASPGELALFLVDLGSSQGLGDLAKKHGGTKNKTQENHLRNDWLNENGKGWWQSQQPIEPILREGFRRATLLVRSLGLPLKTHWIPYGSATPVQVVLSVGVCEIGMDIYTPEMPHPVRAVRLVIDRSVWVIGRDRRDRVRTVHPRVPR